MSRGPGQIQRDIIAYLDGNPSPATYETFRWELFEGQTRGRDLSPDGKLPGKWHTSVKRALAGLADPLEPRVIIESRKLTSIEEFVRHYPGKSLVAATRELRLALLPALVDCGLPAKRSSTAPAPAAEVYDPWLVMAAPRETRVYSQADNELWYVQHLPPETVDRLKKAWLGIEPQLIRRLPHLGVEHQSYLFNLIARAKQLFCLGPVTCKRAIAECLKPLAVSGVLPPRHLAKLTDWSDAVISPEKSDGLRFKSFIRCLVDVPTTGNTYHLRAATLNHLETACPDVVRGLDGYKSPKPRRTGFLAAFDDGPNSTHSPAIHALIDKTVFEAFHFVRLN